MRFSCEIHRPFTLCQQNSPLYQWIAGWMGPSAMVVADKRTPAPARMESFIRLIVMSTHSVSCVCSEQGAIGNTLPTAFHSGISNDEN